MWTAAMSLKGLGQSLCFKISGVSCVFMFSDLSAGHHGTLIPPPPYLPLRWNHSGSQISPLHPRLGSCQPFLLECCPGHPGLLLPHQDVLSPWGKRNPTSCSIITHALFSRVFRARVSLECKFLQGRAASQSFWQLTHPIHTLDTTVNKF